MFPQLAGVTFADVHRIDTPVVMLLGRQDHTTPSTIADAWMRQLHAPSKGVLWFEHSAHLPMIEEPGRVLQALVERVRPLADDADR